MNVAHRLQVAYGAAGLNTPSGFFSKLGIVGDVLSMLTVNSIDLLMSSIAFSGSISFFYH